MREDRASAELSAARQAVRQATQTVLERQRELEEFEKTKDERRDRIYAAILGHPIKREEIDLAMEGVARIDEEGLLKADNVKLAEAELKKKEEAAEAAKTVFIKASKEKMKISEHKAAWMAEEAREQEQRQELELEDFTGKKNKESMDDNAD